MEAGTQRLLSRLASGDRLASDLLLDECRRVYNRVHDEPLDDLLDPIARLAPEQPVAMELLLTVIDELQLARPGIRRTLADRSKIEEANQAVLLIVHEKVHTWEGTGRFKAWLGTVAKNAGNAIRRRDRRVPDPVEDDPQEMGNLLTGMATKMVRRELVFAALERLKDDQREAMIMRVVEQLAYDEIAERMDKSESAVRKLVFRARQELSDLLAAGG